MEGTEGTNDLELGEDARRIFATGVEAVLPSRCLQSDAVSEIIRSNTSRSERVFVMAFGKASIGMLRSLLDICERSIDAGVVVAHEDHAPSVRPAWLPQSIVLAFGGHPSPTAASLVAGERAVQLVDELREADVLVALLSGGGSAMLDVYADGISLEDAASVNRQLLASGADISEINCVRKHISEIKGGRLAARAYPARTIVLAISDVPGDDPAVIASGPFSSDPRTFADALEVVSRRSIKLPESVRIHLERGARGEVEESVKPGDSRLERVDLHVIASNNIAIQAAAREAQSLGYRVVHTSSLTGEARVAGRAFADQLRAAPPRTCVIAGGETTVTLGENPGLGGRNQELGLAAAMHLHGAPGDWCILTTGTDGIDGVTDAAGALIESNHWRARVGSLDDAEDSLRGHNAYPFLKHRQMLLMTGPTGTNVMDLAIGLRG